MNSGTNLLVGRIAVLSIGIWALAGCGGDDPTPVGASPDAAPSAVSSGHAVDLGSDGSALGSLPTRTEAPPPNVTYAGQATTTSTTTTSTTTTTEPPVPLPADALLTVGSCDVGNDEARRVIADITPLVESLSADDRLVADAWADDRGTESSNLTLSQCRAETVAGLVEREWPELVGRIDAIGHGESNPPDSDCSGDCPANRVVIVRRSE